MIEKKELKQMIKKMNQFSEFLSSGIHIQLEQMDKEIDSKDHINIKKIDDFINKSSKHKAFFEYHTDMTSAVFGKWNYYKYK